MGTIQQKEYYVKVTTDPKIEKEKLSNGEIHTYNVYNVKAYDKDGKERDLRISSMDFFKKNQYYIIHWEDRRGILSKKEKVDKTKIDKIVADKLDIKL
ncbi:YxeA family protein [Bacillus cereus]